MSLKNTPERYGSIAKGFHWAVAIIVLALLPLGFFMVGVDSNDPFKLDLYWWHKSFGTLALFLIALRLLWRFANRQPEHIAAHKWWERKLAALVHVLLYVGVFLMPLSGWIMSSAGDFTHSFFGLFDMPQIAPKNREIARAAGNVHEIGAFILLLAIGLHGAGAFKHHFIDRDVTLARMLPAIMPRFGAALALVVFVVFAGGSVVLGPLRGISGGEAEVEPLAQIGEQVAEGGRSLAEAPYWTIVPEDSAITFSVDVQGDPFTGRFTDFSGTINFDPEAFEQSTVDISVNTASIQTGSDERDRTVGTPTWLDSGVFPQATFAADMFTKTGENSYLATGTLTLRGVSRPLEVPFTLEITDTGDGGRQAEMHGTFAILRLDFGVGQEEWANPKTVAHSVMVDVSLSALQR